MTKKQIVGVVTGIIVLGLLIQAVSLWKTKQGITSLYRPQMGEDELEISINGEGDGKKEEITYSLKSRTPQKEEVLELLEEAKSEAYNEMLGKNQSFEWIDSDLDLRQEYAQGMVEAQWSFEPEEIIMHDGSICYDNVSKDTLVTCNLTLSAYGVEEIYSIPVMVKEPMFSTENGFEYFLTKALEEADEESANRNEVMLPNEVEGKTVTWEQPLSYKGLQICLLGCIGGFAMFWGQKIEGKKKKDLQRKKYVKDYPDIVNALVLYMGAGMSIQNAFAKIGEAYKMQKKENNKQRPAYEKILILNRGWSDGEDVKKLFEGFGNSCCHPVYKKLSLLLVQNMTKGNRQLLSQLEQEEASLYASRLRKVKSVGEEASTKLLLPLGGLLIMVMLVVVTPALMTIQI